MEMFSTAYLPDLAIITCIKTVNKNNIIPDNQSEQTYGILQGVINVTLRKQAQKNINR